MAEPAATAKDEWVDRSHPIRESMGFQRRSWRVQTTGWIVMALLALAALLGLFSNGWLSWTVAGGPAAGFELHYQHLYRNETDSWIDLRLLEARPGEQEVVLGEALAEHLSLNDIHPSPLRVESLPGGLRLVFAVGGPGIVGLRLALHPRRSGAAEGPVSLGEGRTPVVIRFYVLP